VTEQELTDAQVDKLDAELSAWNNARAEADAVAKIALVFAARGIAIPENARPQFQEALKHFQTPLKLTLSQ